RMTRVGDGEATNWETALVAMLEELVDDGTVTLDREAADGWEKTAVIRVASDRARLTEPGVLFDGLGFEPWQPPAVVGTVEEDSAASASGIVEGDRIVEIAGERILSFGDLQEVVAARPGEAVNVRLIRNGEERVLEV